MSRMNDNEVECMVVARKNKFFKINPSIVCNHHL